jgi:hypothetical protein
MSSTSATVKNETSYIFRHLHCTDQNANCGTGGGGTGNATVWGKYLNDSEAILNGVPFGNANLYVLKIGNPWGLPEGTAKTRTF